LKSTGGKKVTGRLTSYWQKTRKGTEGNLRQQKRWEEKEDMKQKM